MLPRSYDEVARAEPELFESRTIIVETEFGSGLVECQNSDLMISKFDQRLLLDLCLIRLNGELANRALVNEVAL